MRAMGQAGVHGRSVILGKILGVVGFAALLGLATVVRVPLFFTPVPLTLQNLVVFMAGAMLGPVAGMAAVLLYVTAGTCMGALVFFGPTGGYLLGFVAAAGLIGALKPLLAARNIFVSFLVMASGAAAIYLCGGIWLALGYGWSPKEILAFGILPFIGGDVVKALVAAAACRRG